MVVEFVQYITGNWAGLLESLTQIVGGFALLATLTPNKSDDRFAQVALDAINFAGGNVGKAANPKE